MAAIVEREAPLADDRPLVASVYWNRLDGRCAKEAVGNYLQADPRCSTGRPARRVVVEAAFGGGLPDRPVAV